MKILVGVLIVTIAILSFLLWQIKRQIQDICRQMSFLRQQHSNMQITSQIWYGGIAGLVEELNQWTDQRKQEYKNYLDKESYISQVYTNLSHDIRTPLTSLDGYVQLLQESEDKEEQRRYLTIIHERIHSLKEMLEELFTFSKLQNETYELELTSCSVNQILRKTIFSYYEDWKNRGIVPEIAIEEKPLSIEGNEQALSRVFQNVLKNAMEHGKEEIGISLKQKGETVCIRIWNPIENAEEIDPEQVFERFYKADISRSKTSTGLGLSIAKEFVLRMKGKIHAEILDGKFGIIMEFPTLSPDTEKEKHL